MPRARTLALALLALVALVVAPSLAAGAPRWLAPQSLTPAGEPATTPQVVVGPGGVATMAWLAQTPSGGVVRVARRGAGASAFAAAVDVSAPGAGAVADLVVDQAGAVAVLWTVPTSGPPGSVTLHAAVRPAGSTAFGPAEQVPSAVAGVLNVALAGDGAGGFLAAWSQALDATSGSTALASTRPAGGPWGPPEALSTPGEHALVSGAAGAGGRLAVAWTAAPLGTPQRTVRLRERPAPGQPFAAERTVSAVDARAFEPSVAVGPAGDALVAWSASTAEGSRVQSAFRPAGGDWASPETLGPGSSVLSPPEALVEPDGTASVVWIATGAGGGVVARTRAPGAGFGPEQLLSGPDAPVSLLPGSIAGSGSSGGAIAVWVGGDLQGVKIVRAAVKPAGAAPFGPATTISAPDAGLSAQAGALGPDGEGLAVWIDGVGPVGGSGVLRVADYTERPGTTLAASPVAVRIDRAPRTAVQGSLVRLKLAVDGFAEGLVVRLQQHARGSFRDTGQSVTVNGTSGEFPLRIVFPGKGVWRLAYEDRGAPAFSRSITIQISRPRRPLIAAGVRPKAVGVGFGATWVLTAGGRGQDVVMRLDPRTGRPTGEPTSVGAAAGLAIGPEAVWVSRGPDSERGVVRIDPATGAIAAEVPVISNGAIGAGPAGVWTVECVRRFEGGFRCGEQRVARIEPAINVVAQRFTVVGPTDESASIDGIAVGRRYVWFTEFGDKSSTATRLDPRSGRIAAIGSAVGMAANGDAVVGLAGRGSCRLVGASGVGQLAARRSLAGGPRYRCSALVAEGRDLWVVQDANTSGIDPADARLNSRLVRLDAKTQRPRGGAVTIGLFPLAVDVGEGAIWAASAEEAVVRRIDLRDVARGTASPRPPEPPRLRAPWSRPVALPGSAGREARALDLATGPDGRAAAIWQEARGRGTDVLSAIRPSGARPWGTARNMGPAQSGLLAGDPRVAMNAAGEAVAAWTRRNGGFAEASVQAVLLGPGASVWSAPATLGEPGTGNLGPDAGIAADGEVLAMWSCLCNAGRGPTRIRAAVRPPGGAFAAPTAPDPAAVDAVENPRVAVAPSGAATAVWGAIPGGGVIAIAKPASGSFGAPAGIVPPSISAGANPRVAVNDAGQAVAAWTADGIFAARRAAGGTWAAPQRIAPPGRYSLKGTEIAIDAAGNALVVVRAFDLETYNWRVLTVAQRAGKDGWERPLWLSPKGPTEGPPGPSAGEPSLAMNARGDAVVAWPQAVAGSPRALARLRPAGRLAWRPLEAVSGRERGVLAVGAAIDAEGAPAAAWVARAPGARGATVVRAATRPALRPAA